MSTLLEIEAVADSLPPEQQAELVTFLTSRLARTSGPLKPDDDSLDQSEREFSRLTESEKGTRLFDCGSEKAGAKRGRDSLIRFDSLFRLAVSLRRAPRYSSGEQPVSQGSRSARSGGTRLGSCAASRYFWGDAVTHW